MSTFIIRPRKKDRLRPGFNAERMLDWPDDAVSAARRFPEDPWRFTYRSDVLRGKRERMEQALSLKRKPDLLRRALYVWVFWCPGLGGVAFCGWWTYLIGVGGVRYHGGGTKGQVVGGLMGTIRSLFPVTNPHPLFETIKDDEWMRRFARRHQRGRWSGRPQGKAAVWATVRGEHVEEILGLAQAREKVRDAV